MKLILMLMVLSMVAFADVDPETLHYEDALIIDMAMDNLGYACDVGIFEFSNNSVCYLIAFDAYLGATTIEEFANVTELNLRRVGSAIGAAGSASSYASWSSDYLLIGFNDIAMSISTEDCRLMNEASGEEYEYARIFSKIVFF